MKSKEEFEKNVFAKRDALLRKRKNTTITAVSFGCTALCLTVAISAIKPFKTADTGNGPAETGTYYDGALPHNETMQAFGGLFAEDGKKENEKTTAVVAAEGFVGEISSKCGEGETFPQKHFGYSPDKPEAEENAEVFTMTEIYREVASTKKNPLAGETALAPEAESESESLTYPDGYTEPYFEGEHSSAASMPEKKYPSNEEITKAAFSYLTDAEKASIIDDTPTITMTHYTDKTKGDEYTLYFTTKTGKIKVVLLVDTLELVEKK